MILKTEAICLRYYPFSNTSRIVQWLTRDAGRIATLIKGSQRRRSPFLGQYDLFYTCELVYYVRLNAAVQIARECYPLKTREYLRHSWKACAAASYFCDLMTRIMPAHAPLSSLYDCLEKSLDQLQNEPVSPEVIFRFEMDLLSRLGLAPRLDFCVRCNQPAHSTRGRLDFSVERGGVLCETCHKQHRDPVRRINEASWRVLTNWQRGQLLSLSPHSILVEQEIEDMLGQFIQYHLEIAPFSRAIALDIVRRQLEFDSASSASRAGAGPSCENAQKA